MFGVDGWGVFCLWLSILDLYDLLRCLGLGCWVLVVLFVLSVWVFGCLVVCGFGLLFVDCLWWLGWFMRILLLDVLLLFGLGGVFGVLDFGGICVVFCGWVG